MNDTALMLVTYNRLDLTKRMMDSLLSNTSGYYQLFIVDNGSTDGTVEWLKDLKERCNIYIHLHFNEKNKGIAVGRNQCLKMTSECNSEFLSTLDNDIEVHEGWLEECKDILKANPKFVVGLNMEGVRYPIKTKNGKSFQIKPAGNLGTACTVFRRDLHNQIGFFTTEFGLYGEEDADYFFRARIAGYEMGYLDRMGVHLGQGDLDVGEYRKFKDECHSKNLAQFRQNCSDYYAGKKSLYIPYSE